MSNTWQHCQIKEIGEIITGTTPDTRNPNYWGDSIPFLSPADFHGQKYVAESEKSLSAAGAALCRTVPRDSILVSCIGTIGKMAMVSRPCSTNQQINAVVCSAHFLPDFIYYLLHQNVSALVALSGTTTLPIVNKTQFGSIRLHVPPLPQQRKIARILTTLDNMIAQTEALIAKYQAIKQGLMHDLFTRGVDATGKLRPPQSEAPELYKQSDLGWIPKEWVCGLVDDFATRGSGHTPDKSVPAYWNGDIQWVSLADSANLDQIYIHRTEKRISEKGLANSSAVKHPPNTVIVTRDGQRLGKSAIISTTMAVSQHFMAWQCGPDLKYLYFYYWLQNEKPRFTAIAIGSTILTIGLSFFRRLKISVPPRGEQDLASNRLLKIDMRLVGMQQELDKLKLIKTGLMQDLLTGKVRVNVEVGMENDEVEGGMKNGE